MNLFEILLLSIPVFYILGIVYVIKLIKGGGSDQKYLSTLSRQEFLVNIIEELRSQTIKFKNLSVEKLIEKYEEEIKENTNTFKILHDKEKQHDLKKYHSKPSLSNWTNLNSINILLYLGAFLIVASATIFLSFQWDTLSGLTKAISVTVVALSFFATGLFLDSIPKLRQASSTFAAIGALLIPVSGAAFYNFVFKQLGTDFSIIWLITSVISLVVYILLAIKFQNRFYAYLSSVMILSFTFSTVGILSLNNQFYILAGISSSFILLFASLITKKITKKNLLFDSTYQISAQIVMPTSLIIGLLLAAYENNLFTQESTIATIMATIFYLVIYRITNNYAYIAANYVIFAFSVISASIWQNIGVTNTLNILSALSLAYLFTSYAFLKRKKTNEADAGIVVSVFLSFTLVLFALKENISQPYLFVYSLIPTIIGYTSAVIKKEPKLTILTSFFLSIAGYVFYSDIIKINQGIEYLSIIYIVIAVAHYLTAVYFKSKKGLLNPLLTSTAFFTVLSLALSFSDEYLRIYIFLFAAIISLASSLQFKQQHLTYVANTLLTCSLIFSLKYLAIDTSAYPLALTLLTIAYYGATLLKKNPIQKEYLDSALVSATIVPIFFGIVGVSDSINQGNELFRNALITSYIALVIFSLQSYRTKRRDITYVTSAVAIVTLLWQIFYLDAIDILFYTIPLGLYFIALAYTQHRKKNISNTNALSVVGICWLIIPSTFQLFDSPDPKHILVLLLSASSFITIGISFKNKIFKNASLATYTLSILPYTYEYLFTIPRWLIVGGIGITFLAGGVILLLKRKDS